MKLLNRIILIVLSITFLVCCDTGSKQIARSRLMDHPVQSYLGGVVQLFYVENPGGMLSFGYNLSGGIRFIIFQVFISIVLVIIFGYVLLKKDLKLFQTVSFVLFISGGLGNLIDRFTNNGKVIDFIILQVNGLHTGVFNLADFYITIGVSILLITNFFPKRNSADSV